VTPVLFKKYPTPEKLAKAPLSEVEKIIHSCGFYRNKAKSITKTSQDLVEKFKGEVPSTLEDLTSLAGVGRKTASVVMNQAYDLPAIAVDTHVARVSARLGWTEHEDPFKIEMDLRALLPESQWSTVNTLLILHGRRTCKARKPLCDNCSLNEECPSSLILLE
jgi:endonuclease-3